MEDRQCKPFEIKRINRRQANGRCQTFNVCPGVISLVTLIMNSDIMWSNTSQNQERLSNIEADRLIAISVNRQTNDAGPIRMIDFSFFKKTDKTDSGF
jgi:hypothetical protein